MRRFRRRATASGQRARARSDGLDHGACHAVAPAAHISTPASHRRARGRTVPGASSSTSAAARRPDTAGRPDSATGSPVPDSATGSPVRPDSATRSPVLPDVRGAAASPPLDCRP